MTPPIRLARSKLQTVTIAAVFLAISASAQTIQGTVTDAASNKPISGAIVLAIRNALPPLSQNTTSTSAGAFQFSNLTAGTYRLCVQVLAGGYLDPCMWSTAPPTVTLAAGKSLTGEQLKITAGSILSVRINDPSNLLGQLGKSGQAPPVAMAVHTTAGFFQPLVMHTADATGSEHQVTIPFDSAIPIWVHSAKLALTQTGGAAVPAAGLSLPVTHPSASAVAAPQVAFQITGIKP